MEPNNEFPPRGYGEMTNEFDVIEQALKGIEYESDRSCGRDVLVGRLRFDAAVAAIAALATLRAKSAEQEAEVQRLRGLLEEQGDPGIAACMRLNAKLRVERDQLRGLVADAATVLEPFGRMAQVAQFKGISASPHVAAAAVLHARLVHEHLTATPEAPSSGVIPTDARSKWPSTQLRAELDRLRTELAEANEAREGWLTQARTLEPLLPTWRAGDPIIAAAAERLDTLTTECATQRGIISECKDMLAARAKRIERLEAALQGVAWRWVPTLSLSGIGMYRCALCSHDARGHAPDCLVGMALKEGE